MAEQRPAARVSKLPIWIEPLVHIGDFEVTIRAKHATPEDRQAVGDFVVRVFDSHDALIEAAALLLGACDTAGMAGRNWSDFEAAANQARAALKRSRGEHETGPSESRDKPGEMIP